MSEGARPPLLILQHAERRQRLMEQEKSACRIAELNYFAHADLEVIIDPKYDKKLRIRELTDSQIAALRNEAEGKSNDDCKRIAIGDCAVTWEGRRWFVQISSRGEDAGIDLESFNDLPSTWIEQAYQKCLRVNPKLLADGPVDAGAAPVAEATTSGQKGRGKKPADGETQARPASITRNKVFISYSHKDKKFFDELLTHLKPLARAGRVSSWSDNRIRPGSKWLDEIRKALASAKVAVMLVTKDFLASDFIHEHELGPLLKEAEQGGVQIRWVLVRACNYKETPLKDYQAVLPLNKALAQMKAGRDQAWVEICEEITKAVSLG